MEFAPHAFELDPGSPEKPESDAITHIAEKYRMPVAQATAQVEHISSLGRAEGLDFNLAGAKYTNTFDAHRLMKLALATGDKRIAEKLNESLFEAFFGDNLNLADKSVLAEIGGKAGLKA